ncbi:MAG: Flp family type IVb pilin [Sphingomonas sp.]
MSQAILRLMRRLCGDRKAATAVEYGLILAIIVVALIGAIVMMADATTGMWNNIDHQVTTAR